jgi:hypothetical protein
VRVTVEGRRALSLKPARLALNPEDTPEDVWRPIFVFGLGEFVLP